MPQVAAYAIASAFGIGTGTIGFALIQIGVGLAFNFALQALTEKDQEVEDKGRGLNFPAERPPYRFPYGYHRVTGTPLPWPVVGDTGYAVYQLSSRPMVGNPSLFLDGRHIPLTGDPYDFSGPGATPSDGELQDHLNVWYGLGDQTGPPDDVLAAAPFDAEERVFGYKPTDAFQGRGVVWMAYRAGKRDSQYERWPSPRPALQVEGFQTAVWDPRDPAQDPNDPATWQASSNWALVLLDVLRNNPFRPFPDKYLLTDPGDIIAAAADAADELIALASGGTEPRYEIDGTVVFSGEEMESILAPLLAAGAGDMVRRGGKLGFVAGVAQESARTIHTANLADSISFSKFRPGSELKTEIRTSYISARREFTDAELKPYPIPGASPGLEPATHRQDLPYTTSATRAMRLREILARKYVLEGRCSATFMPECLDLSCGDWVSFDLGADLGAMDMTYQVREMHVARYLPGSEEAGALDPVIEEPGIALRVPVQLEQISADVFAWSPEDEEEINEPEYAAGSNGVQPPGTISSTTGNDVNRNTGGTIIGVVRHEFAPSPSAGIVRYEWEWRVATTGTYGERSGTISPNAINGEGDIRFDFEGDLGVAGDWRVRAVYEEDRKSPWVYSLDQTPNVEQTIAPPILDLIFQPDEEVEQLTIWYDLPNDPNAIGMDLFVGPDDNVSNATEHPDSPFYGSPNSGVTAYYSDGPGTYWFFTRTRSVYGAGAFDDGNSASIT